MSKKITGFKSFPNPIKTRNAAPGYRKVQDKAIDEEQEAAINARVPSNLRPLDGGPNHHLPLISSREEEEAAVPAGGGKERMKATAVATKSLNPSETVVVVNDRQELALGLDASGTNQPSYTRRALEHVKKLGFASSGLWAVG
ncbi:hypothetical protein SDJN03_16633, partial [Cucurbita argyrosperma subsp. sororia]